MTPPWGFNYPCSHGSPFILVFLHPSSIQKSVATRLKSAISARMVVFYKTRNQIISTVIIQINPFYGCLKASSNRYLLFTVHPLSSNSDIVKLRSYKRLWESDCLALIQPASLLRRLVNLATHCSSMREFHQFQAAAWFVITWLKWGPSLKID